MRNVFIAAKEYTAKGYQFIADKTLKLMVQPL